MTFLLPLVALALAFAAPFVLRAVRAKLDLSRVAALVALLVGAGVVVLRSAPEIDRTPCLIGLTLGAAACVLSRWGGGLGFGVAAASTLHLLPVTSLPAAGMALVAGTGLGALAVGGEISAIAAVLVVAADNLGMRHSQIPAAAFVGSQIGVAMTIASLIPPSKEKLLGAIRPILVGAVVLLAYPFLSRGADAQNIGLCLALGALAGVIIQFLMPDEESEASRAGLAAVIGIGLATVAFSLEKGVGMAVSALAAGGVLLALGNRRAVLALGPVIGLVLFRVLREAGTGATRALDISQHYTLLALVLGLTLPVLPTDWLASRSKAYAAGALLWGIVAVAAPPLVVVALGMRGGVGFIVGLGVVGLVGALKATTVDPAKPSPLALGTGIAGATILALSWLGDESAISRDQKIHLFAYAAAGIIVISILLALAGLALGGRNKEAVS